MHTIHADSYSLLFLYRDFLNNPDVDTGVPRS